MTNVEVTKILEDAKTVLEKLAKVNFPEKSRNKALYFYAQGKADGYLSAADLIKDVIDHIDKMDEIELAKQYEEQQK